MLVKDEAGKKNLFLYLLDNNSIKIYIIDASCCRFSSLLTVLKTPESARQP